MVEKAEFRSDVGQAVIGDVNEAPRLKNVVHLNIGNEENKPLPITDLQRRKIASKVKELIALTGQPQLQVYGVILSEFGAETIAKFPRDRYKDAIALLDRQIDACRAAGTSAAPTEYKPTAQAVQHAPQVCQECAHQRQQASHARLMMILQTIVMVIGAVAWGFYAIRPAEITAPETVDTECHFEGKAYSIGSAVKMGHGVLRECLNGDDGVSRWGVPRKTGGR